MHCWRNISGSEIEKCVVRTTARKVPCRDGITNDTRTVCILPTTPTDDGDSGPHREEQQFYALLLAHIFSH